MGLSTGDRRLIAAMADGLPIEARPYQALATTLGMTEAEVIARLGRLLDDHILRRFGVIVDHHALGYRANAMAVWDVPDERLENAAQRLAALPFLSLCYQRPRRLPDWPYNLFCMIHGRARAAVETSVEAATLAAGLGEVPRAVLFSRRRFKQRGARYVPAAMLPHPQAGAA
jgi:DNA-binding Lrp family transcriptional regulator